MTFFYKDYTDASRVASELDARVATDSLAAAGQDYLTITSLSVRQTFGALQFAGTEAAPLVFLKEISSNSDIQTVDVISRVQTGSCALGQFTPYKRVKR